MPAYVIVEVTIHDPSLIVEYQKLTPATLAAFDGNFLVRGGKTVHLEGDWDPERIVILQFPSVEKARDWWNSEQYSKAKGIRKRAASTRMIIVEGV